VAVSFDLEEPAAVRMSIFDLAGRPVRTLFRDTHHEPGAFSYTWDGRDDRGRNVPPGAYLYRLDIGAARYGGKLVRVR
jgi:flagellar hook assembly protein FlgD